MTEKLNTATPGVLKALSKSKSRSACDACGFPMPVYPGRYPSNCPMCKSPRASTTVVSMGVADGKS